MDGLSEVYAAAGGDAEFSTSLIAGTLKSSGRKMTLDQSSKRNNSKKSFSASCGAELPAAGRRTKRAGTRGQRYTVAEPSINSRGE
jgi:hypothetical protein